jgi:hypothetical protein
MRKTGVRQFDSVECWHVLVVVVVVVVERKIG